MNNLIKEFNELIELIKDSDLYKKYIRLEELVKKSNDINKLVEDIKELQKKIVNLEHKNMSTKDLEEELNKKKVELNLIPLYNDYTESIDELNNMLLIIKNKFDNFIKELLL